MTKNNIKLQWLDPKHRRKFEAYAHPEGAYLENVRLCKGWILPLRVLEESLRYRCVQALNSRYGDQWWDHLGGDLPTRIQEVSQDPKGTSLPWESWIDSLSFGFWTSLFNGKYEQKFWNPLHRQVFPQIPKSTRRKDISSPLNGLRNLRNDLFHHAVILNRPIQNELEAMDQLMEWLGSSTQNFYKNDVRPNLVQEVVSEYK